MTDHNSIDGKCKLFVGNLPLEATTADLQAHFSQLGEPIVCLVTRKGQGCVGYGSPAEANSAAEAFNGSEVGGNAIQTIVWSKKFGAGKSGAKGEKGDKGAGKGGKGKGGGWGAGGWGAPGMGYMGGMDWWGMDPITAMAMKGGDVKGLLKGLMKGKGKGKSWDQGGWDKSWGGWEGGGSKWSTSPGQAVTYHKLDVAPAELVAEGYPAEAPAVEWAKGVDVFGSASHILSALADASEAEIVHDPDWEKFPDIGEAWKAATGEENCFAVATHKFHNVWGIGVAGNWKGRQAAAQLALALAIVQAKPGALKKLQGQYPEFVTLTKQVSSKGSSGGGQVYASSGHLPQMRELTAPETSDLVKAGLAAEGVAIVHDGKHAKEWFSNSGAILGEVIEDVATEVEFVDDPDGEKLPEVHAAWQGAGNEESCICVAKHAGLGVWAAGVASGWKFREAAAKMALALTIAKSTEKGAELLAKVGDYPEFGELHAGLTGSLPAAKRRKK